MSDFARRLRLAIRSLRRTPGSSLAAVITLSLGIGLTTAMFSIVYGVLFRELPYREAERIAVAWLDDSARGARRLPLSVPAFHDYAREQGSFVALGAYAPDVANVSGSGAPERAPITYASHALLEVLGVSPVLGRAFTVTDEDRGARVALLSHAMWRDRFASAPGVLGREVRVDGLSYTIIGVMPAGFSFPEAERLWLLLPDDAPSVARGDGRRVIAIGKLKPGVSIAQAGADLNRISRILSRRYPKSDGAFQARAGTFGEWSIGPQPRRLLYAMLGAVFSVLLIACVNVMNLLLSRAVSRARELGIRAALGGSRGVIAGQFLLEALVLAVLGAAGGVGLAGVGLGAFRDATAGTTLPSFVQIGLYLPVLGFAASVAVLASVISGTIPAVRASRVDLGDLLKDSSRSSTSLHVGRLSRGLVALEIALSGVLLVAAGLMTESVVKARTIRLGFEASDVFTAALTLPAPPTDTAQMLATLRNIEGQVRALPGVRGAGLASGLPGTALSGTTAAVEGVAYQTEDARPLINTISVTPEFFSTVRLPPMLGRLITQADRPGAPPVIVVTQRLVRRLLPPGNPIGRRLRLGDSSSWFTIVGVVPDIFGGDPSEPYPAIAFRALAQAPTNAVFILARSSGPPLDMVPGVRHTVAGIDPDLPLDAPLTLADAIAAPLWFVRVFGTMFVVFGVIALVLATVGLYAVTAFWVGRRTREIGIRMALGASRPAVVRLVVSQGFFQVLGGLVVGLILALGVSQLLSDVLFAVRPGDPVVLGTVAGVIVLSCLVAFLVPALRATGMGPVRALRED